MTNDRVSSSSSCCKMLLIVGTLLASCRTPTSSFVLRGPWPGADESGHSTEDRAPPPSRDVMFDVPRHLANDAELGRRLTTDEALRLAVVDAAMKEAAAEHRHRAGGVGSLPMSGGISAESGSLVRRDAGGRLGDDNGGPLDGRPAAVLDDEEVRRARMEQYFRDVEALKESLIGNDMYRENPEDDYDYEEDDDGSESEETGGVETGSEQDADDRHVDAIRPEQIIGGRFNPFSRDIVRSTSKRGFVRGLTGGYAHSQRHFRRRPPPTYRRRPPTVYNR